MESLFCQRTGTMKKYRRYEIWYANVRYEDSDEVKERPILIWNDQAYLVVSYKLTGTDRGDNNKEYRIKYWKEAGLAKPTSIRIEKILQLTHADIRTKIGVLDPRDQFALSFRFPK